MSESDKDRGRTSDSGIDTLRKSRSGSGSFEEAGHERSSFDDYDSQRGSYDDDVDVDDKKVDLSAFLDDVPPGDDVGDEDDEEEEEDEEEDDEEEDDQEDEYETEDEEVAELAPGDELLADETASQVKLDQQREHNKQALKDKKKALIREYIHDVRRFSHLRAKNYVLTSKISSRTETEQKIIEYYMSRELEERERLKEVERLKQLHESETCKALANAKKDKQKNVLHHKARHSEKKQAAFSTADKKQQTSSTEDPNSSSPVDFSSLKTKLLTDDYEEDLPLTNISKTDRCQRRKHILRRTGRTLRRFSFMRSLFYKDVIKKAKEKGPIDLSDLSKEKVLGKSATQVASTASISSSIFDAGATAGAPATPKHKRLSLGGNNFSTRRKRKFTVTKEALELQRSKARMAIMRKQEQVIRLGAGQDSQKDLHHFEFEFAENRFSEKTASSKLREELMRTLERGHVPTEHLRWPLEVAGVHFDGKNPYGRVALNYTTISHHDKDHPHHGYRILLNNLSYLRMKDHKLQKEHRKNMVQLEEERNNLQRGVQKIFEEILDAIRIYSSLCGITDMEKREARTILEGFIQELQRFQNEFLSQTLIELYTNLYACQLTLRRLSNSEGKGEGAELHEFKDILRSREKLKAEHRNIEKSILQYQRHSLAVLKLVRKTGKRMRSAGVAVGKMEHELNKMKKAVSIMIAGMHHNRETLEKHRAAEINLKSETGILSSPTLSGDYNRMLKNIEDAEFRRVDLQRLYNSRIREMEKIMAPPSRFVRYKVRS